MRRASSTAPVRGVDARGGELGPADVDADGLAHSSQLGATPQIARAVVAARVAVLVDAAGGQVARVARLELEDPDAAVVPGADPERAVERHQHLVAAVRMRRGDLAGPELERRDGQVLGAGQHAAQHAEVAAVQHVARPHHPQARLGRRVRRPVPEPGVVGVARCLEVGLGARVGARRARGGRRREQLQHAQRLRPEGERVVPGVAAEEHALPGPHALDLAGLGVGDDHRALEHVQHLVGGEDRAEVRRVAEAAAGRHPEQQHVDLVGRGVDPVEHLARLRVAPDVAGDVGAADLRRPVERRPRRGGRQRRPVDERHSALRGSWTRSFAADARRAGARSGSGKPSGSRAPARRRPRPARRA